MNATDVEAARLLLARMGITPEQLLAAGPAAGRPMPTFRVYIAEVSAAVPDGTRRAYATYWRRIDDAWGDRRIDEPTPLEIKQTLRTDQRQRDHPEELPRRPLRG